MKTSAAVSTAEQHLRRARRQLEEALRAGTDERAETLLAAFPAVADDPHAALELVYTEFAVREQLGQHPSPDAWYARFPQWRDDLRQMFEVHDELRKDTALRLSRASTAEHSTLPSTARLPARIGEFELQGEIGRGGMGVVYKARQPSLGRTVAVKVILSGAHAGERERARFRREAETAARLDHANIVRIYEVGESDGRPYCAMEFVDGRSLAETFTGTPWPPRRAAELIATVAAAADHAHQHGVIHRDLKPANVLLARGWPEAGGDRPSAAPPAPGRPSGGAAVVKIVDFGLAKSLTDTDAGGPGPTRTGDIIGTPTYMAPEQADPAAGAVGPPTDVWALGVTLYELLVGHPPFRGETSVETLQQVRTTEPVSPRRLRPGVPRDLEVICQKCLRKRPADRYATAAELNDDLNRWLRGEAILARPVGAVSRTARWCRRNPRESVLLAALAVLLVGGPILFAALWLDARAARTAEAEASRDKDGAIADKDAAIERLEHQRYGAQLAEAEQELAAGAVENVRHILDGTAPRFRNLEADYLFRLSACRTQRRPFGANFQVAAHPDGTTLAWAEVDPGPTGHHGPYLQETDERPLRPATARRPHRVQIRARESGELIREWTFTAGRVHTAAFADRGRSLVVTADDPAVAIWDVATGTPVHTLPSVAAVRVVAPPRPGDGRPAYLAALAPGGGSIRFWDTDTGAALPPFELPAGESVQSFVPSPDQTTFAVTARHPKTNQATGYVGRVGERGPTRTVGTALNPSLGILGYDDSGKYAVARGANENLLLVVESANDRILHRLRTDASATLEVAFDCDGQTLAAKTADGGVSVWQLSPGKTVQPAAPATYQPPDRTIRPNPAAFAPVSSLRFFPSGELFVEGQAGQWVGACDCPRAGYRDLTPEPYPRDNAPRHTPLPAVWFHPDGARLFCAGPCGFDVWDVATGRALHADRDTKWDSYGMVPAADGSRFVHVRGGLGTSPVPGKSVSIVELWSTDPLRKVWEQRFENRPVLAARFTPTGDAVVVVSYPGHVTTHDAGTGAVRTEGHVADTANTTVAVPPAADGVYWMAGDTATGGTDVRVTDPATGRLLRRFNIPERSGRVGSVHFGGGDRLLCSSWGTDYLQSWDVANGRVARTYRGTAGAMMFAVTADEKRILALGSRQVTVWDSDTGQKVLALPAPPPLWNTRGIAVAPDGKWIAVVGHQGQVRLWAMR